MANVSLIFKVVIIIIVYCIIVYALKIMYNDMKNEGKRRPKKSNAVKFGLEIMDKGQNYELQDGGVIPINDYLTIGRSEDNMVILSDRYVSSHHLKIYMRNNEYILEDLGSTNGTFVNDVKIASKVTLRRGDRIKVGSSIFKVLQ
ncbi:FHA domain-containing protein [Clostridium sp. Marseille-QA1073]